MKSLCHKALILSLLLFFLIFNSSCNSPNLDGHWHLYYGEEQEPLSFYWDIRNDTLFEGDILKIGPDSFKIRKNHLSIIYEYKNESDQNIFKYDMDYFGDSCFLYQNGKLKLAMYKRHNCKIYEHCAPLLLNLNLPVASEDEITSYSEENEVVKYSSIIYVGKPKDESKKGFIQLNDMIADLSDLPRFIDDDLNTILVVDKNIELNYLDSLLFILRYYQTQRITFLLEIQGNSKKMGLIRKRFNGIENLSYYKTNRRFEEMLLPPQSVNLLIDSQLKGFRFYLNKNQLLFTDIIMNDYSQFKDTLRNYFSSHLKKNEKVNIVFEWDTASIFDFYAKVSVILDNTVKNYRKEAARFKFNKNYDKLTEEEIFVIKEEFPVNLIEISPADRYAINKKYGNN